MIVSPYSPPIRAALRAPVGPRSGLPLDSRVRRDIFAKALGGAMLSVDRPAFRFQDSTGQTPGVGTSSEPVGLLLDQWRGIQRGAEQRAAGSVSSIGTSTVASYDGSAGAGAVYRVDGSNQSGVTWTGLTGQAYEVTFTITAGSIWMRSGGFAAAAFSGHGVGAARVILPPGSGQISLTSLPGSATFTGLSIREIPGTHFGQSTSTSRPVVVADGRNVANAQFDGGDDTMPALASVDYSAAQVMAVAASLALTNSTEGVIFRSTASGTTAGTLTLIGNRGGVAGRIAAVYRGTGGTDRVVTLDAGATGTLITARAEADRTTGELRLNVNGVDATPLAVADLGTFAAGVPSLSAAATPLAMKLYAADWIAAASLSRSQAALLSRWAAWKMGA